MVQRDVNCGKTTTQGPSNGSAMGKSGKDDEGRSGRAAEVSASMTLSSLFLWNPQQKTFSEETILFQ